MSVLRGQSCTQRFSLVIVPLQHSKGVVPSKPLLLKLSLNCNIHILFWHAHRFSLAVVLDLKCATVLIIPVTLTTRFKTWAKQQKCLRWSCLTLAIILWAPSEIMPVTFSMICNSAITFVVSSAKWAAIWVIRNVCILKRTVARFKFLVTVCSGIHVNGRPYISSQTVKQKPASPQPWPSLWLSYILCLHQSFQRLSSQNMQVESLKFLKPSSSTTENVRPSWTIMSTRTSFNLCFLDTVKKRINIITILHQQIQPESNYILKTQSIFSYTNIMLSIIRFLA